MVIFIDIVLNLLNIPYIYWNSFKFFKYSIEKKFLRVKISPSSETCEIIFWENLHFK